MSSWFEHSTTPIFAAFSSESARRVNGKVVNRLFTSEKKLRLAFILRLYVCARGRTFRWARGRISVQRETISCHPVSQPAVTQRQRRAPLPVLRCCAPSRKGSARGARLPGQPPS